MVPYAAITYPIKPGHEEEIAEIFADFKRVDSPTLSTEWGEDVGRLLGTAVFIKDDIMVRVIHYEGSLAELAPHMSRQIGLHGVERRLAPYLAEQREARTSEGFQEYFRNASMRCISQLSVDSHPAKA